MLLASNLRLERKVGRISAEQLTLVQVKNLKAKMASGVGIPSNPPKLLWVVWDGEEIAGIFVDWPSASACIGVLVEKQNIKILLLEKQREDERTNPRLDPNQP
jgi:hypothetical protein